MLIARSVYGFVSFVNSDVISPIIVYSYSLLFFKSLEANFCLTLHGNCVWFLKKSFPFPSSQTDISTASFGDRVALYYCNEGQCVCLSSLFANGLRSYFKYLLDLFQAEDKCSTLFSCMEFDISSRFIKALFKMALWKMDPTITLRIISSFGRRIYFNRITDVVSHKQVANWIIVLKSYNHADHCIFHTFFAQICF